MIKPNKLKLSIKKTLKKSLQKLLEQEKGKHVGELRVANKTLAFQNKEIAIQASELTTINEELILQIEERDKRAGELLNTNKELASQNEYKEKRIAELTISNSELAFQTKEKAKTEQELILSERRLTRAQQVAHMGNWELDFATNVVQLSAEACRIYGLTPDQNRHSFDTWLSFIHPKDLYFASKKINESRDSLRNFSFYHRIIRRNGVVRYIYSESNLEFGANGKSIGLYGITHDVNQIKLAEIERTKVVNDLVHRNIDLEQFGYIVSHNLRAPVANILGASNELEYPGLCPEEKEMLGRGLRESVMKLDDVVKDLNHILEVKREITNTKEKVHFSTLVEDIKSSIKNLIDKNKIEIRYNFDEIDEFLTIKSYVYSIFHNLIFNSIKYRQPQVPVIIEIKSLQMINGFELTFNDNGMGIDLKKRGEQVFGLYKRFHTTIEGKGMGLFMVKTQVETLGGKINIRSEVNKGTEFKIEFEL